MSISRVFAAAAIAVTFSHTGVQAQSSQEAQVPAENPPASFQGRQYVDSAGCVFIRAEVDGAVHWVPRVTGARKAICGFQPSFAVNAAASAGADQGGGTGTATSANVQVARAQKAPDEQLVPVATEQLACPAGQVASRQSTGQTVVCVRKRTTRAGSTRVQRKLPPEPKRVVPLHVYEGQKLSVPGIRIPKGYKPAWDDDRLNPRRAHQTLAGKAQMERIWTTTLPRQLIRRDR